MDWAREARWAWGPGPLDPEARARAPPRTSPSPHKPNLIKFSFFFEKIFFQKNMKMIDEDGWMLEFGAENDTK